MTAPSLPAFCTIWRRGSSSARLTMVTPICSSTSPITLPSSSGSKILNLSSAFAARTSATPPPGTMPSSTAARVACIASSTRAFFSFNSVSVAAPTRMTSRPPPTASPTSSAPDAPHRAELARAIKNCEHLGDELTHEILVMINKTFITPFDREDIYRLAGALDDVLDAMEEAADRIVLYRLDTLPPGVAGQVEVLRRAAGCTATAMPKLEHLAELEQYWIDVNSLEEEADTLYRDLLGDLLAAPDPAQPLDVLTVLKTKEVVEILEEAADAFETVANTVQSIAVKES